MGVLPPDSDSEDAGDGVDPSRSLADAEGHGGDAGDGGASEL
jgi:hypothetical protein